MDNAFSNSMGFCPACSTGKLLYNGQGLVCICCPYTMPKPDSEKCIPAVRTQVTVDDDCSAFRRLQG